MKNIFFILLTCFSIFSLNSCREDGEWGNENGGQFGFTIERDATFIEKAVGETNQLKFNIKPSYDFASIATTFKFTTSLNGTLKLNGETLVANKEYTFTTKDNIFEYIGNVAGTHDLKISVKNSKGASKVEDFELKYSISEFTHTYTGGSGDIYQGDNTSYLMKISPGQGQPTTGYEIKFNSYNGTIKLNGVTAQTGQFYSLPNIDNFTTALSTNQAGQGALSYTIKNSTVEKDYTIQQNVIARKIIVESMNINNNAVTPNSQLSLSGVITKSPQTTNNEVKYKTWISSASNGNTSGIQNTSNVFQPYFLQGGNNFLYNFTATQSGVYTYNIQFQDEYGNLSDIKSFNITVSEAISVSGTPNLFFSIYKADSNSHYVGQVRVSDLNITANVGNKITKIEVKLKFRSIAINTWYDRTNVHHINPTADSLNGHTVKTVYGFKDSSVYVAQGNWNGQDNVSAEVIIYDDQGRSITITPSVSSSWYSDYNQSIS